MTVIYTNVLCENHNIIYSISRFHFPNTTLYGTETDTKTFYIFRLKFKKNIILLIIFLALENWKTFISL